MKFGHAFQEALAADSYPRHWVERAIPYRQLKKLLGKVREELLRNGFDPDTLHRLIDDHSAEYRLESDASSLLRPRLVVRPSLHRGSSPECADGSGTLIEPPSSPVDSTGPSLSRQSTLDVGYVGEQDVDGWVEIPLDSDARFFGLLQSDVNGLDILQEQEREQMMAGIHALGDEISKVARPRKSVIQFSKSDLYRWREIFEVYLAAEVFFSTNESAGGLRGSDKARQQLVWFQDEVNKRQLPQKFKIQSSAAAYSNFLALNAALLQNLRFQELNQTAVTKIIKKFDKRTALRVKATFPKAVCSAHFISEAISKDICAQLGRNVVSLVPQVVDYTCTICLCISWLPVRLDCNHVFCIRCMIKMQNQDKRFCPLCRAEVIQRANENHIDEKLLRFLERWFPKETKEKQAYNELERRKELFGEKYVDDTQPCAVM